MEARGQSIIIRRLMRSQIIEYVDDLGRTSRGTRAEARENGALQERAPQQAPDNSAYAEVLQSNIIRQSDLYTCSFRTDGKS